MVIARDVDCFGRRRLRGKGAKPQSFSRGVSAQSGLLGRRRQEGSGRISNTGPFPCPLDALVRPSFRAFRGPGDSQPSSAFLAGWRKWQRHRNCTASRVPLECGVPLLRSGRPASFYPPMSSSGVQIKGMSYPDLWHTPETLRITCALARCLQFHVNKKSTSLTVAIAIWAASPTAFWGMTPLVRSPVASFSASRVASSTSRSLIVLILFRISSGSPAEASSITPLRNVALEVRSSLRPPFVCDLLVRCHNKVSARASRQVAHERRFKVDFFHFKPLDRLRLAEDR